MHQIGDVGQGGGGLPVGATSLGLDPNMKRMGEIINPPDFLIGELANLSGQAADPFKIPPGTAPNYGD